MCKVFRHDWVSPTKGMRITHKVYDLSKSTFKINNILVRKQTGVDVKRVSIALASPYRRQLVRRNVDYVQQKSVAASI